MEVFCSSFYASLSMKMPVNQPEILRELRLGLYATFYAIRKAISLSSEKY